MRELIRKLPKVELHLHLDGSLRVKTVRQLSQKLELDLPVTSKESLADYLQVSGQCADLGNYLEKFELPIKLMQTPEAISRIAYELVEDLAAENVRYAEIRFAPLLLTEQLSAFEVVEAALDGLKRGEKEFGVIANLILCCMRDQDPSKSIEVTQLAIDYLDAGVVGIDLAGDEDNFPPEEHEQAFQLAKGAGLNRTVHAGEAAGATSVKKAIDYLSAQRIGHGIRTIEDREVLAEVVEEEIPLEICPTSNLQTKVISDLESAPIRDYYELGIPITINTDNRTVSNTTLSQEYVKLHRQLDFSLAEIKELIINGLQAGFIEQSEKERLVAEFKAEFTTIKG
ncbi:MAG: adenosine deaminase [Bacillota bacterium]